MMDFYCYVDLYLDYKEVLNDIKSSNYYVLLVIMVFLVFEGIV